MGDLGCYRRKGLEIMVGIYCDCGKEVGELCFAGHKHLGMWRMNNTVSEEKVIKNMNHWLSNVYESENTELW